MPEYTTLPSPSKSPNLLLIGGGAVAVIAIVVLLSKKGGAGGTTAAGSSINAALGSLQEEQQNLLGVYQAGQLQNTSNFASVSGEIADTQKSILAAITSQGQASTEQIQGAINTINANTTSVGNSTSAGILSGVTDALNKLLAGQQQITSTIQATSQAVSTQLGTVQSNTLKGQQDIITQLGNVQQSEQNIINNLSPQLVALQQSVNNITAIQSQIFNAQQALAGANAQDAQVIKQKIDALSAQLNGAQTELQQGQASIIQGIAQGMAQNQVNFNYVQANLGTYFPGIMDYLISIWNQGVPNRPR